MQRIFSILGCGSSGGVPRIGGYWGNCDPVNPKNQRSRCSLLVQQETRAGTTQVLIDTSPDMRRQLIGANVGELDGVLYTHAHADHVHGIDDLRQIALNTGNRVPVWADAPTQKDLLARFDYVFTQPEGSEYPPVLEMNPIDGDVIVSGDGGAIPFQPILVAHGRIDVLGFRIGDVAYIPDVSGIYGQSWPLLEGLSCLIIDALRHAPHPSHTHLKQTLQWIAQAAPKQAILTNMHFDLDYDTLLKTLPPDIYPAYDGLKITCQL